MEQYKERLIAEYRELSERYHKLEDFIIDYKAGVTDIELGHDLDLLLMQKVHMYGYRLVLYMRLVSLGLEDDEIKPEI